MTPSRFRRFTAEARRGAYGLVLRYLLVGLALGCLAPGAAAAAERRACLTPEERNAAIAARKAVPLGRAMRVVQAKVAGEVVSARLCRQEPKASSMC